MTYELLDSGDGRKLERVGSWLLDRQCAVAFWKPRLGKKEWDKVDAYHHRSEKGGGHWEFNSKLPESWQIEWGGLQLKVKPTAFGHLGFFAEQAHQWAWFRETAAKAQSKLGRPIRALNLFAYTGGSSLALMQGGAEVTHVDAAKGVVDWCRQNAELNGLVSDRLRLIVDDAIVFLKREARRGRKYDGVLLDPPSFGRGPNKEVFKIEEDAGSLLEAVAAVLEPEPVFAHLSCHSPGFTPEVLHNLLSQAVPSKLLTSRERGEMVVTEQGVGARPVPSGAFCRVARSL